MLQRKLGFPHGINALQQGLLKKYIYCIHEVYFINNKLYPFINFNYRNFL